MKNMKSWGIASIALGIFGFFIAALANTSELTEMFSSSGGKTYAEFFPFLISGASIAVIIIGISFIVTDKKPLEKKQGKILDVQKVIVTVEFTDGRRKNLNNVWNVPVVAGDDGTLEFKGNVLMSFYK